MVTAKLVLINVAVYAVLAYLGKGVLEIDRTLLLSFGLSQGGFWSGKFWQILSSMFVHFDIAHLGFNMVFLTLFGFRCEEIYGRWRFLFIYLASGLFASLVFIVYPPGTVSAGASGAIFGVLGANLVALRGKYSQGIWSSIIYGFVFFILAKSTGFAAHLAGLVFGFAVGYILTRNWYPKEEMVKVEEQDFEALEREMEEMKG